MTTHVLIHWAREFGVDVRACSAGSAIGERMRRLAQVRFEDLDDQALWTALENL